MASIVVVGPGAIGGAVAGALIDSGHPVVFAPRTPFDSIDVEHPGGRIAADAECVRSPADRVPSCSLSSPSSAPDGAPAAVGTRPSPFPVQASGRAR